MPPWMTPFKWIADNAEILNRSMDGRLSHKQKCVPFWMRNKQAVFGGLLETWNYFPQQSSVVSSCQHFPWSLHSNRPFEWGIWLWEQLGGPSAHDISWIRWEFGPPWWLAQSWQPAYVSCLLVCKCELFRMHYQLARPCKEEKRHTRAPLCYNAWGILDKWHGVIAEVWGVVACCSHGGQNVEVCDLSHDCHLVLSSCRQALSRITLYYQVVIMHCSVIVSDYCGLSWIITLPLDYYNQVSWQQLWSG